MNSRAVMEMLVLGGILLVVTFVVGFVQAYYYDKVARRNND